MEMRQVSNRVVKHSVTCAAKRTTWHQNADSKTKLHMTIGTSTNSRKRGINNNNNIINKMIIEPTPKKSRKKYTTAWRKVGALSKLTNFVDSMNLSQGNNNQTKIMEWD